MGRSQLDAQRHLQGLFASVESEVASGHKNTSIPVVTGHHH